MAFCEKCGNQLNVEAKFCAKCGKQVVFETVLPEQKPIDFKCVKCGTEITAEDKFCPTCGMKLTDDGVCQYSVQEPNNLNIYSTSPDKVSFQSVNDYFKPTKKSSFKKLSNILGIIIAIIIGGFLLVQTISGGGVDPNVSFNTIVTSVVIVIIIYLIGRYKIKNKCKKCKYFDKNDKCIRMNMYIYEAINFDCLCR